MNILTGSSGYIGSFFRRRNYKNIKCFSKKKISNATKIDCYLNLPKSDYLIFLSESANIEEYATINKNILKKRIQKTKKILDSNKHKKIIYISSNEVYNKGNKRTFNYIYYKKTLEKHVLNKNGIVLRISTVIGKPIKKNSLIKKLKTNKNNFILDKKNKLKDFIHINDLILIIKNAIKMKSATGIYRVTSNYSFYINDLYYYFDNKKRFKDKFIKRFKLVNNTKKTKAIFNWQPKINGLDLFKNI